MTHPPLITLAHDASVVSASDACLRCMGDLRVLGALLRVDLDAAGAVGCDGDLAGGRIVCGGALASGTLGRSDLSTEVWVGAPPPDARELVERTLACDAALARELLALRGEEPARRETLLGRRRGLAWRLDRLSLACGSRSVRVEGLLAPGVSLRLGLQPKRFTFLRGVAGPLEVRPGPDGGAVLRQGDRETPLHDEGGWVRV